MFSHDGVTGFNINFMCEEKSLEWKKYQWKIKFPRIKTLQLSIKKISHVKLNLGGSKNTGNSQSKEGAISILGTGCVQVGPKSLLDQECQQRGNQL